MSERGALSSEELEFIQQLFSHQQISQASAPPAFTIDGGPQANTLLSALANHAELTLQAQLEYGLISFPLTLVEDELHGLKLEIGVPLILEKGTVLRPWRMLLKRPLKLREASGTSSALRVLELAPGSILLDAVDGQLPPDQFDLWLALPGIKRIPIHGQLIRRGDGEQAAYQFQLQQQHSQRIRRYLFKQYRERHPQLQAIDEPS